MQTDPQTSGDYVLPILSFFDGTEQSRNKNITKLQKMLVDLNIVSTHPYLLLTHLQPSLSGKRAPLAIENMSGKFQGLVMLAKRFSNPEQHVAIVCEAGQTTDLVELVLSDRALNVTRYSSPPTTKLYKKEITKRRGATFHIVPSELKDLRQAVYAAFDAIILLDNKFDVNSQYGQGLRAQLRDPVRRRPLASVIRLVALNSAQHIALSTSLSFDEQIAATVVRKKQVGALPSQVKQFYMKDLSPLQPFINNCDGPFLLPAFYPVKQVGHKDVERALYLDDEDQYQVDFANRQLGSGPGSRRGNKASTSEDEDSGSEGSGPGSSGKGASASGGGAGGAGAGGDSALASSSNGDNDLKTKFLPPNQKRRRIELEDGTVEICKQLSDSHPLSAALLIQLNDQLAKNRLADEELASHRELASVRQLEIETLRAQMNELALKYAALEKSSAASERRAEKLRLRNEKVESELRNTDEWWSKLSEKLTAKESDTERIHELVTRITKLEADATGLRQDLANEKSRFAHLQSVSQASSEYGDRVTKERDTVSAELASLKSVVRDEPAAKELAMNQQLKAKSVEIGALRAELDNLRESIKVQLSQERASGRTDRRYGGRGGRGASRQASPHISVYSS